MKKKEKATQTQTQKQKEFAVSPFKGLKTMALGGAGQKAAPKPSAAPKKPVKTIQELSDEALFLEAMADVSSLTPRAAAPELSKAQFPKRSERDAEEERVFLQAVEALKIDVRFSDELPEQDAPPRAVNRLRQVRRGSIRIDLQLDLHGLTRDEALENLDRFVKGAYNRGQKGVLVITGKGNNSPGEPVLKSAVASWLREAGKGMVSEFVPAPREMGGSGALVVFLKEKKNEEEPKP